MNAMLQPAPSAPTVVQYVDLDWVSASTQTRWNKFTAPKARPKAEPNSTSNVIDLVVANVPEHVALHRLRTFKSFQDNWDGERSAAPNLNAIGSAIKLLSLLSAHGLVVRAGLGADGSPILTFAVGGADAEIIVKSADTIDYYVDQLDGDGGEGILFDGKRIPQGLMAYIRS